MKRPIIALIILGVSASYVFFQAIAPTPSPSLSTLNAITAGQDALSTRVSQLQARAARIEKNRTTSTASPAPQQTLAPPPVTVQAQTTTPPAPPPPTTVIPFPGGARNGGDDVESD